MSIALATKGRLWPSGGTVVVREHYVDLLSTIVDPIDVTVAMEDVSEVSVTLETVDVSATVEVVDTVTGSTVVGDLTGSTEGCF